MKEELDLRIPESLASEVLHADDGKTLGGSVRRLVLRLPDDRLEIVRQAESERRDFGKHFVFGWTIRRSYSEQELSQAAIFVVAPERTIEPAGEECGTVYDESAACELCGAGATIGGFLWLSKKSLSKDVDVARTIAGEIIVSQRCAEIFVGNQLSGFQLRRVLVGSDSRAEMMTYGNLFNDPLCVQRAAKEGIDSLSNEYVLWIDSTLQREAASGNAARQSRIHTATPIWYSLCMASEVDIANNTKFGDTPFDDPGDAAGACPLGHVLGLARISELWIHSPAVSHDFMVTRQFVGTRRGLLRPNSIVLASQRARGVIASAGLAGFTYEVANLIDE